MKRFLIISCSLMVLVLVLAVAAFVYVQFALAPTVPDAEVIESIGESAAVAPLPDITPTVEGEGEVVTTESATPVTSPLTPTLSEPISLSSLPLSDTQKDLLRGAGIDPETFVITPEMVRCAEERLGAARFAEIVAGDAPGPTEVFSLLRCL